MQGKQHEPSLVQRQEDTEEEEAEQVQMKRASPLAVQRPDLSSRIQNLQGGEPLPASTRAFFEPRFGSDFTHVRVHTGGEEAETAQQINAQAFTRGRDIVFGPGRYQPQTPEGQRLLAHELTHVVQQRTSPSPSHVQRKACGHDNTTTGCGASLGRWLLVSGETEKWFGLDTLIVQHGLRPHFGGTWAVQVQTPPNSVKHGVDRGYVDGLKVKAGSALNVEVVEIKARSTEGGGCARATGEATEYVNTLNALGPQVAKLSTGLSVHGGLRVPRGAKPTAEQRKRLAGAGTAPEDPAWTFYNSLQNALDTTFSTPFAAVSAKANADGDPGTSYKAGPPIAIRCPKWKGGGPGTRQLAFQVNKLGGVSYGCEDECTKKKDEKEKHKHKDLPKEYKPTLEFKAPEKFDTDESEPLQVPPEGIDVVDVAIYTGSGLATLAVLAAAAKKYRDVLASKAASAAEKKLAEEGLKQLEKAAERTVAGIRKVDPRLAGKLNGTQIAKKFGTKAYDDVLEQGEKHMDDVLKRMPKGAIAKRLGPKAAEKLARLGGRAFIILGIVLTAKDALALADQLNKGAELKIGFSLDESELAGETKVELRKPEGAETGEVGGDVKMTDTTIDIELDKMPRISGSANIETKSVSIRGPIAAEGDPVTVNLAVKMENVTIVFKHSGTIKGGDVVLDGALEISNSTITIDLPPDAKATGPRKPGETVTIKGKNLTIKEAPKPGPGASGAEPGKGGAGGGKGAEPKPEGGKEAGPPTEPVSKERAALLKEITGDKDLKKLFEQITTKSGGVPISDEALRQFVELKALVARHPEKVETILAALKPGPITDPIAALIGPMREALLAEDAKLGAELEKVAHGEGGEASAAEEGGKESATPSPAEGKGNTAALTSVKEIAFKSAKPYIIFPEVPGQYAKPPDSLSYPVEMHVGAGKAKLVYRFTVKLVHMPVMQVATPAGYKWAGTFMVLPPSGEIRTVEGDRPIRFIKGSFTVQIGQRLGGKTTKKETKK